MFYSGKAKEDSFLMSLFLHLILFHTRSGLALVKFYNAAVRRFLKTFKRGNVWDGDNL